MEKWSWTTKVIVMGVCSLVCGIIPALALMLANYHYDSTVCWPDEYGAWFIVPMVATCIIWGGGMNVYMEKKMKVCNHGI